MNRSFTYGNNWNAQGKVRFIGREDGSDKAVLVFHYDGMGNRVRKVVVPRDEFGETLPIPEWTFTYYIRDAQGNHLTTLERRLTDIDTEEGWDELHAAAPVSQCSSSASYIGLVAMRTASIRVLFRSSPSSRAATPACRAATPAAWAATPA